jgi:hypothetical protein
MKAPARRLQRLLNPYHEMHHQWWCWLMASAGADGWRRVAVQIYHFMRLANRLLRAATQEASRCGSAYAALEAWGRVHAPEEEEHPDWLLEDLVAAGSCREEILASLPDEEIDGLARTLLALIHASPSAVLGLCFATECYPPDAGALLRAAQHLGLPREALRTMLHHSQVDQEHGKEILHLIDSYGRAPEQFRAMALGAVQIIDSWTRLFQRYSAEAVKVRLPR